MGSKGGAPTVTNTNQTQTNTPAGAGYVQSALDKAQSAASQPFNIPQAPVAGFSQDQLSAFNSVNNAQGMAQPYINQASQYFTPQGAQDFLNPYAANVMAGMKDVFGQQQSQTTGQLTQAAGGVGADRIGVGQANLANQQGLAAGTTLSGLYGNAVQQAQSAGYGTAALGSQAQNAALTGAQAQLATGGLQQQLQQAQLNAPYQQQLAQSAFPYQQAQFLAGITGSLAPGLGGTTSGYGSNTTTPPAPNMWSQILGAGTAAAGIYGQTGGFGGKGSGNPAYGGNGVWGGSSANPLPGLDASDYGTGYDEGGAVSEKPIDISKQSIIPTVQMQPMQMQQPQLNLNPPAAAPAASSGTSAGDVIKDVGKIAMMFANRGGRTPYDAGGVVDVDSQISPDMGFAEGGDTDAINSDEPFRMPGQAAMDDWRSGADTAMAFSGDPTPASVPVATPVAARRPAGAPIVLPSSPQAQNVNPYSQPAADPEDPNPPTDFAKSPWAALTAAGLGMMGGTSPYAGVNIGQGGMQGLKTLEEMRGASQKDQTIAQAAKRLSQEAQFHEDQYTRETVGQKATREQADRPYHEMTMAQKATLDQEKYTPAGSIQTKDGLHPAFLETRSGRVIDGITGEPPEKTDTVIPKGGSRNSPEEINSVVDAIVDGSQPPTTTGLYGDTVHVKAGLKAKGFDLAKAQQEWDSAKKQTAAVNSSRMTMYVGLNKSVDRTIDEVRELGEQMKLSGVPMLNRGQIMRYMQLEGNSEKGQLATRYITAVNTLKEEFANLANGGYAPTEAAWKLANEQVNKDYGVKQLHASIDEIQRLIRYRLQAIPNITTMGPGAPNRYTPSGAAPPAAPGASPPAAAPRVGAPPAATRATPSGPLTQAESDMMKLVQPPGGGGSKPDVIDRFKELTTGAGAKSEEEAYAILHAEGYQ